MPRQSSLRAGDLSKKDLQGLNEYIRQASKILNDRQRYLEILSGRRKESGKRVTSTERVRNLEIDQALYIMSSKAMQLNAGQKTVSSGGSIRFSGKGSKTIHAAFIRATEMKRLIETRITTVKGLEKNLIGRMKGLSQEIFGDSGYQRLKSKEWDEIFGFFEIADKYGFPSDVAFKYVIQPFAKGKKIFNTSKQFKKWILEQRKKSSALSLEKDLRDFAETMKNYQELSAQEKRDAGLRRIDDVIKVYWSEF